MSYISLEQQLENFRTGFPFLNVISPATPAKGIKVLSCEEQNELVRYYDKGGFSIVKFVPASGAASRMFKDLFEGREALKRGENLQENSPAAIFLHHLPLFPFYKPSLFSGKSPLEILNLVLDGDGLNFGSMPKGLIPFHKYNESSRTAFEEHLVEGALYALCDGKVSIHYTVSAEHREAFKRLFESVREKYETRFRCKYEISFSEQSPDTNMIAVNLDNTPFIKDDGTTLFRPGGHGALLGNLASIKADIIVVKNIDNIVKESLIEETVRWKKILIGKMMQIRKRVFLYLNELDGLQDNNFECEMYPEDLYQEISAFLESEFCITIPSLPKELLPEFLRAKLNRPIRVCGMVKNEGEPGGGPFIVKDADGSTSLQILEGAQLDANSPRTVELLTASTHFNPVDLVCSTIDYCGRPFDLTKFTDPQTGLISGKSYEGRKLKAQELPGLWNGSMSNWNTLFIETPLLTFNPVKSVLDLLRPEHC